MRTVTNLTIQQKKISNSELLGSEQQNTSLSKTKVYHKSHHSYGLPHDCGQIESLYLSSVVRSITETPVEIRRHELRLPGTNEASARLAFGKSLPLFGKTGGPLDRVLSFMPKRAESSTSPAGFFLYRSVPKPCGCLEQSIRFERKASCKVLP